MQAITCRFWGALMIAALLAASPSVAQQADTFEVEVSANTRSLLARAESLLADGRADQAFGLLSASELQLAGNPYFDYLLGVAALDTGRLSEAVFSLRRALAVQPSFAGARLELARAYFESDNRALARPIFVGLLDEAPPPDVRVVIQQYIDAIDAEPPTPGSRLSGFVETFVGHDTNANGSTSAQQFLGFMINPDSQATESPFAEAAAGFDWVSPTSPRFAWLANGRVSHRVNPDASFVDSTLVSGFGGGIWQRNEFFGRLGVDGYWATRDGESNESYAGIDLLVGRRFGGDWDLSLGVRSGANRFRGALSVLDVDRTLYTLGVSRNFSGTSRFTVQAIGGNDREKQAGSPYGNSKTGARAALSAEIGEATFLHASLGSLTSDFDGLFFGIAREDTQVSASLSVEFRDVITDGLMMMPTIRYVDNDSNVAIHKYDRTEIGLLIRWSP